MNNRQFKEKAKWLGLVTGGLFLVVSTYLEKYVINDTNFFDRANFAATLQLSAVVFALATLLFGATSFPQWQSIIAILIFAYALYWVLFVPPPAIS